MGTEYYVCPYCSADYKGKQGKKAPKTIGSYRMKVMGNNALILQCNRCGKVHRIQKIGGELLWPDMNETDKKAFKKQSWHTYGGENEQRRK